MNPTLPCACHRQFYKDSYQLVITITQGPNDGRCFGVTPQNLPSALGLEILVAVAITKTDQDSCEPMHTIQADCHQVFSDNFSLIC